MKMETKMKTTEPCGDDFLLKVFHRQSKLIPHLKECASIKITHNPFINCIVKFGGSMYREFHKTLTCVCKSLNMFVKTGEVMKISMDEIFEIAHRQVALEELHIDNYNAQLYALYFYRALHRSQCTEPI